MDFIDDIDRHRLKEETVVEGVPNTIIDKMIAQRRREHRSVIS